MILMLGDSGDVPLLLLLANHSHDSKQLETGQDQMKSTHLAFAHNFIAYTSYLTRMIKLKRSRRRGSFHEVAGVKDQSLPRYSRMVGT
jgi:hypothetical protein